MNPLTVLIDIGYFQAWQNMGFDNELHTNPLVHRKLTKLAFTNLLHPFQPFVLGQLNFKLALEKKLI